MVFTQSGGKKKERSSINKKKRIYTSMTFAVDASSSEANERYGVYVWSCETGRFCMILLIAKTSTEMMMMIAKLI